MSADDHTSQPDNTDNLAIPSLPPGSLSTLPPRQPALKTREQRLATLRRCGLIILCIMAIYLVVTGGVGSIKWDNDLVKSIYPDPQHRYALAALNLSSGLILWIAIIGLYVPLQWGLKLNVVGCVWYLAGTIVWEIFQGGKVAWTESLSDIVFWSTVPIVQIVCILVGSSANSPKAAEGIGAESGDA